MPVTGLEPMDTFDWHPDYSVGNDVLDEQHKVIFDICRRVHDLPKADSPEARSHYHELLDEAVRFARTHFHTEEHQMRKLRYAELDAHIAEHRQFMEQLSDILLNATAGRIDNQEFAALLANWLTTHILETDMKYKPLFM